MDDDARSTILLLHVALGFAGFVLGAIASALPKFGRDSRRHRWVGRAYAVCMLGMAVLSIPLSLRLRDYLLLTIGILTLGAVVGGWIALRVALRARQVSPQMFVTMLQTHITLMGSSYIAAWTAFFINVRPLGDGSAVFWVYALGPTVIGSVLLQRARARFSRAARTDGRNVTR